MNRHSRTHNSARNILMAVAQKFFAMLLTFVGRQIFLQVLTVEHLGLNSLFADILGLLSLADLGLGTVMAHSFHKPLAENDEDKLAALIQFYRKLHNIIAAAVAVLGLAALPFLGYIINIEGDIPHVRIYYIIALTNTVKSYLFAYKASIITADQNRSIILKYRIACSMIGMAAQIVILLTIGSFMLFSFAALASSLAANLLIARKADRLYPFIKRKAALGDADKRSVYYNIKSMAIVHCSTVIRSGTNSIFISMLIATAVVGQYANYMLAVTNLTGIAFILFNAASASIGNLVVKEAPEKRLQIFKVMQTAGFWISGFFVFCLFFLLDDFVLLWLGYEFLFDAPVKIAISVNFYLNINMFPVTAFREATGIYKKTKYIMAASAAIKIALTIVLGRFFGITGIISATFIAKLLTYAWYEPRILFRDFFDAKASGYFIGNAVNLLAVSSLIALTHFFVPWPEVSGWIGWLVKAVIFSTAINAVYLLRYFRTPEFRFITQKAKSLIKAKKR